MREANIGNNELITKVNRSLVLRAVRAMQPTFRAEVARRTQLKPATITGIVNELIEQRLLREEPMASPAKDKAIGRPPAMLSINSQTRYILAIDLEPDCLRVALTNLLVEPVEYREHLIDRFSEPIVVLRQIEALCKQVLSGVKRRDLLGAGVSLPGLIDQAAGRLVSSTNMPKWRDVDIADWIERHVGIRPQVQRATLLAALHEAWRSPEDRSKTSLLISLRTGIGMTLIQNGEVNFDWGGELGHMVISVDGKKCECGGRGCLETFVSASAVCDRAKAAVAAGKGDAIRDALAAGEQLRPELVYRLAKAGDPACVEIVRDVSRYIGLAAAGLVNLFKPDELIICGSIDTADELVLDAVREQIDAQALPRFRKQLATRLAVAKEKSAVFGAAVLVARDLFALPMVGAAADAPAPLSRGRTSTQQRRRSARVSLA